jgi:ATP-dependent Clp protease ATP-binding subunit ClpC
MVGAPPGYVGYTEGGALTESVRRRPYSIVLLDEIEKAHQDVFNILLQVFDDGRLTDGRGRTADFSNTVIFMTSNLGAAQMKIKGGIGFGRNQLPSPEKSYEILKRNFLTEVEKFFSLEFRNRIDAIIVFKPLTEPVVRRIIDKFLRQIHDRPGLRERNITLQLDDSVYEMLMEHGYSYELGAREMERTIQKLIIDPLGQELAQHDIPQNSTLYVRIKDDQIDFCHKT